MTETGKQKIPPERWYKPPHEQDEVDKTILWEDGRSAREGAGIDQSGWTRDGLRDGVLERIHLPFDLGFDVSEAGRIFLDTGDPSHLEALDELDLRQLMALKFLEVESELAADGFDEGYEELDRDASITDEYRAEMKELNREALAERSMEYQLLAEQVIAGNSVLTGVLLDQLDRRHADYDNTRWREEHPDEWKKQAGLSSR